MLAKVLQEEYLTAIIFDCEFLCIEGLNAAEIAESEKIGDPICSDGGGRSRREIHKQLINMVSAVFGRELKKARIACKIS